MRTTRERVRDFKLEVIDLDGRVAMCNQCFWWDELDGESPRRGLCRLNPPVVEVTAQFTRPLGLWPMTHSTDYCGAYTKEDTDP